MNENVDMDQILLTLPQAVWVPTGSRTVPKVYRGTPIEMVEAMAKKSRKRTVKSAVAYLLTNIAKTRKVEITIPLNLDEDELAGLFIHALLDTGLIKPLPQA